MAYLSEICADLFKTFVDYRDKDSAQGPFIILPPEILSLVCGFLPNRVKQMHQVSRTWGRAAVPYLSDRIFLSLKMADLRIAKLVILHSEQYIRTLVFSSV